MDSEIAFKIKAKMQDSLLPEQMKKLEVVLSEILGEEKHSSDPIKENDEIIQKFLSAKRIEGCSKRTEQYYSTTLLFFVTNMKCNICTVDTNSIREYLISYQKINNCSNVTLDNVRRILSSFYNWLEEENFIIKSPMRRIHKIKTPSILKPAFSDEQIEVIRKSASQNKRNIAIIDLFLSSGIRVSELIGLNLSSIDLDKRTCIVFGKGAKQRETYFDVRTKIELENYIGSRDDDNDALFITSRKNGESKTYKRLTVNTVEKMIRLIGINTKIEKVHPHRFRRTMATRAIDKGMPIEQVQVLLGHTKIDTTLRYANVQQSNVRYSHQKFVC